MAYIPRSSFIPKEASGAIPMRVRRKRTIHVFSLLTTLLLIASVAAAGGVYFYENFLEKRLDAARIELNAVSDADIDAKMEEIRIYDDKLKIAHAVLDNHIAASRIFEEIEQSTKQTVQFKKMEYEYDPGFEAILTLGGNTEEFTSLALQKMQLIKDNSFSELIIKDIGKQEDDDEGPSAESEDVVFTVTGLFKKAIIEYTGVGTVAPETPATTDDVNEPTDI